MNESSNTTPSFCGCGCSATKTPAIIEVDARGLMPPQPLIAILEASATLPDGAELRAQTDRRPMHLYAELEKRGFASRTEETENGTYITYIHKH